MSRHTTRALIATGALTLTTALVLTGCGSGFQEPADSTSTDTGSGSEAPTAGGALTVLIGSSGDAETKAVEDAVAAWSAESGTEASVQVANDLPQQLSQGFASNTPPDLFYLSTDGIAGYAANGSLAAYGDKLSNKDDFYPSLVENFTVDGNFYCAPKDFSTLALVINKGMWDAAGLTDADIPTTWEDLTAVAKTLTADGHVGLAFGAEYQRIGTFMAQAGGGLLTDGAATADSDANVAALDYVKTHLNDGTFAYASEIGAGWGGEALGKGLAAMVIEGNWITGAMQNDFPDVDYVVAELPAGPGGKGTLQFTNCWGMAADSKNQDAALDLVEYLTSADSQLAFSEAFGPMPSIQSAADQWTTDNPALAAFLNGAEYAQFPPNLAGAVDVITDFNGQLATLKTADAKALLSSVQSNLSAIVQ